MSGTIYLIYYYYFTMLYVYYIMILYVVMHIGTNNYVPRACLDYDARARVACRVCRSESLDIPLGMYNIPTRV